MKLNKKLLIVLSALLMSAISWAQAPQLVTSQAVVRDASGLVANRQVSVRVSILQGSASGSVVYRESHTPTTNINGLYTISVGGGSVLSGNFASIDWGNGPYFVSTEVDPNGGSNYSLSTVQPLLSVPYALYANRAARYAERQVLSQRGDTIFLTGGSYVVASPLSDTVYIDSLIRAQVASGCYISCDDLDSLRHRYDSIIHIYDTLFPPEDTCVTTYSTFDTTVCKSFMWINGRTYTAEANDTAIRVNAAGCDSVITLNLTVLPSDGAAYYDTACLSYTWATGGTKGHGSGEEYSISGTYIGAMYYSDGCPNYDTLFLTVATASGSSYYDTACGSYTWAANSGNGIGTGDTYTEDGTYYGPQYDVAGCTGSDTLHLIVRRVSGSAYYDTACAAYIWPAAGDKGHGTDSNYTVSGDYVGAEYIDNGCPVTDTLHLVVNEATVGGEYYDTICGSYTWATEGDMGHGTGVTYTESGHYSGPVYDVDQCVGYDILHLEKGRPESLVADTLVAIADMPFHVGDTVIAGAGCYQVTLPAAIGCDTTLTLTLNVLSASSHNVCAGSDQAHSGWDTVYFDDFNHDSDIADAYMMQFQGGYRYTDFCYMTTLEVNDNQWNYVSSITMPRSNVTVNAYEGKSLFQYSTQTTYCVDFYGTEAPKSGTSSKWWSPITNFTIDADRTQANTEISFMLKMDTDPIYNEANLFRIRVTPQGSSASDTVGTPVIYSRSTATNGWEQVTINLGDMATNLTGDRRLLVISQDMWSYVGIDNICIRQYVTVPGTPLPEEVAGLEPGQSATYSDTVHLACGADSINVAVWTLTNGVNEEASLSVCSGDLPTTWRGETIASGTATGDIVYTRTLEGGCDSTVTLHLEVTDGVAVTATPNSQDVRLGNAIEPIQIVSDETVTVADLPAGVTYDAESLRIIGTPTEAGDYTITITATSGTASACGTTTITATLYVSDGVECGLNGLFSVNAQGGKVQFSCGNLQWLAKAADGYPDNTWRFAEHQYDFVGGASAYYAGGYSTVGSYQSVRMGNGIYAKNDYGSTAAAQNATAWIDLFPWGTSGWSGTGVESPYEQPYVHATVTSSFFTGDLTGEYANADWGVYNNIVNGGGAGLWRTMTKDEWYYLLNTRPDAANKKSLGSVQNPNSTWSNDVYQRATPGMILLPDDFTLPSGCTFSSSYNSSNYAGYYTNYYTQEQWALMEAAGAVFLPAGGYRRLHNVYTSRQYCSDYYGVYWTATTCTDSWALEGGQSQYSWYVQFDHPNCQNGNGNPYIAVTNDQTYIEYDLNMWWGSHDEALSVRLVHDIASSSTCETTYGTDVQTACESFTWTDGNTYTESNGTALDTLRNVAGCDSIVTLNLTINQSTTGTDVQTACDSYTWIDGNTYTESNTTAIDTLQNTADCDSVVTLNLTINQSTTGTDVQTACDSYTWIDGNTYTESNTTAIDTLQNTAGCDSVVTLNLTIQECADECGVAGSLNGDYSVSATLTVRFAQGNLQYTTTGSHAVATGGTESGTWRFAEHQYDYIGAGNLNTSATYEGWIDKFCWGTSGWSGSGANEYMPYSASTTAADFYVGGSSYNNLTGDYANADWGVYNAISNGGNQPGIWRTLTSEEWDYLCNTRSTTFVCGGTTTNDVRYCKAKVGDTNGLIIFCDNFTMPSGMSMPASYDTSNAHFDANTYTIEEWERIERAGAVFLPAAGDRNNDLSRVSNLNSQGAYWSSSHAGVNTSSAKTCYFYNSFFKATQSTHRREAGFSVRLVTEAAGGVDCTTYGTDEQTACDSYEWMDGVTYTESNNTATFTLENAAGHDSVVTLNLTINHSTTGTDVQTACDSYTWIDGNTYTESNTTAIDTLQNVAGCDSVVTLNLTINTSIGQTYYDTACGSYTWATEGDKGHGDGNSYSESGTYTGTEYENGGCAVNDTLHLTITTTVGQAYYDTACGSYTWATEGDKGHGGGNSYSESGTYTGAEYENDGCTVNDTLHLIITTTVGQAYYDTACNSYMWATEGDKGHGDGNSYSESGTYTGAEYENDGCTVSDTLHLTITTVVGQAYYDTACNSYTWATEGDKGHGDGNSYSEGGTFTGAEYESDGCTVNDTLHLTITTAVGQAYYDTACNSYTWATEGDKGHGDGNSYSESGTYTGAEYESDGCTVSDTLLLTINIATVTGYAYYDTTCSNLIWSSNGLKGHGDDQSYSAAGEYVGPEYVEDGCPMHDTLHVAIVPAQGMSSYHTACDSYTWSFGGEYGQGTGLTYTESGDYVGDQRPQGACIVHDTLHLTINHSASTTYTYTACGTYTWATDGDKGHGDGNSYSESGTYVGVEYASDGCPSSDTLHLTISTAVFTVLEETVCVVPETVEVPLDTLFFEDFESADCLDEWDIGVADDEPYYVTDWVRQTQNAYIGYSLVVTSPENEDYAYGGSYAYTPFIYIEDPANTELTFMVKMPSVWNWESTWYTDVYRPNDLKVFMVPIDENEQKIQVYSNNERAAPSYTRQGTYLTSLTQPGWYSIEFVSYDKWSYTGIDNILLTRDPYQVQVPSSLADRVGDTIIYDTLTAISGCDSIVQTTRHIVGGTVYTVRETESFTWTTSGSYGRGTGETYYQNGDYLGTSYGMGSCTVNDVLHLIITDEPCETSYGTEVQSACDSYTWIDGNTYTESNNTATHTLQTAAGCDSVVTLNLTINHANSGIDVQTACNSYTWIDGQTYAENNSTATHTLQNVAGCDSVVTLNLTIRNPIGNVYEVEEAGSFTWEENGSYGHGNNETYTESGEYVGGQYSDEYGCELFDTLRLTITAEESDPDAGTLNGRFSVSETTQVVFSQGNLQYNATAGSRRCADGSTQPGLFRFAEHQYDWCGYTKDDLTYRGNVYAADNSSMTAHCANIMTSNTYDGWIDLFGYGTSGWRSPDYLETARYMPYETYGTSWGAQNTNAFQYYCKGHDLVGDYANADWGVYNPVTNGGNTAGIWRTLTWNELYYMIRTRADADQKWSLGQVMNTNGLILLPDRWTLPEGCSFTPGKVSYPTSTNRFNQYNTAEEWQAMERAGAVFLPVTAQRDGSGAGSVKYPTYGTYWTASRYYGINSHQYARVLSFYNNMPSTSSGSNNTVFHYTVDNNMAETYYTTHTGLGIRLVKAAPECAATTATDIHEACGSYEWIDGNTYTESNNTAQVTIANVAGCDSVVTLNLTIHNPVGNVYEVEEAGSFTWEENGSYGHGNNETYTESGEYVGGQYSDEYGCELFDTLRLTMSEEENNPTAGVLNGRFSVSETTQVQFSCGNLQWLAKSAKDGNGETYPDNTWRFANYQYDFCGGRCSYGCPYVNISSVQMYNGTYCLNTLNTTSAARQSATTWIDLFGWGTSGWSGSGAAAYQPYTVSSTASDYITGSLVGDNANADWGHYNNIYNGGNAGTWRLMTRDEWNYLLNTRTNAAQKKSLGRVYISGSSNYIHGMILLPDEFTLPSGCSFSNNYTPSGYGYYTNTYTESQWNDMEAAGAVFLPMTGYRVGSDYYPLGEAYLGSYWTSTTITNDYSYTVNFSQMSSSYSGSINIGNSSYYGGHDRGNAVRLVRDYVEEASCETTYGTDNHEACNSYTWIDGQTYTESNNTAIDTLSNIAGCDSVVTLNLTLYKGGHYYVSQAEPYTWPALGENGQGTGQTYTESGDYAGIEQVVADGYCGVRDTLHFTRLMLDGMLLGKFSVSDSKKVYFSQGNLQYLAKAADGYADGTFRFAVHQYEYVGNNSSEGNVYMTDNSKCSNEAMGEDYSKWVDLFGYGTSGWDFGGGSLTAYMPYSTSQTAVYVKKNLTGTYAKSDWGVYNPIVNGGNNSGLWRTLDKDEWLYLFNERSNAPQLRGAGIVAGVRGLIILPDDDQWQLPDGCEFTYGSYNNYSTNTYDAEHWALMEAAGAAFFPMAGTRTSGTNYANTSDSYWTSSWDNSVNSYHWNFSSSGASVSTVAHYRGASVRLACDAPTDGCEVLYGDVQVESSGSYTDPVSGHVFDESATYIRRRTNTGRCDSIVAVTLIITSEQPAATGNGTLSGTFSVSATQQVNFSKGNLQYVPTGTHQCADGTTQPGTWQFADKQYIHIGNDVSNRMPSSTQTDYMDLFGWATSGWSGGGSQYMPYAISTTNSAYGSGTSNMYDAGYTYLDWGVYNAISNGGNQPGLWFTMSKSQWEYLMETRAASTVGETANARFVKSVVSGQNGVILFPDSYTHPDGLAVPTSINDVSIGFSSNFYDATDWQTLEEAGAVFLPATGYRYYNYNKYSIGSVDIGGYYWTSTSNEYSNEGAYQLSFIDVNIQMPWSYSRSNGNAVRLVRYAE